MTLWEADFHFFCEKTGKVDFPVVETDFNRDL
jgi:hypothetical protein